MARKGYLYRRSSGIYVVRICIPKRLQSFFGRGEIHVSTGLRDATSAKATASRMLSIWQQRVLDLDSMDILKIAQGSPLLFGEGLIRFADVALEFETDPKQLLMEVINSRIPLLCIADGWNGIEVADINEVERENDGTFVLNGVFKVGENAMIKGQLVLFDTSLAAQSFLESGEYLGEVFYRDLKRHRVVFFEPGQTISIDSLLVYKSDAERIRLSLSAGITTQMLDDARALRNLSIPTSTIPITSIPITPLPAPLPVAPLPVAPGHKYGAMRISELLLRFLQEKEKKKDWKADNYRSMSSKLGVFIELMDDPVLSAIDRPMIHKYRDQLQTLPSDIYQARRRHKTTSLKDLITAADLAGDVRMKHTSANLYIRRLSEMLGWAVKEEWMTRNPAAGVGANGKRTKKEQDERKIFDDADLDKIFQVEWFQEGKGELTANGRYNGYQPHYYWLPLLALYSGGRLNELSQLYLDDVVKSGDGHWYLDFNLNGSDKMEADPKEEQINYADKSLKTINSQRIVTLHEQLTTLGFIDYVKALRKVGHVRLFPELRFDETKGYGKAAGSWFNERFLGKRLGIVRNGTKTFHSFRHMFITNLFDEEVPEATVAQLAGHKRGETMSAQRYRKDQEASKLQPYIARLKFTLPTVAKFDIKAGLIALEDALKRKERHHKERVKLGVTK